MSKDLTADALVIGCGIVGASCAFHLAERGLRVRVIEQAEAPATGSTAKSVAGVRAQFSTESNIRLSLHSLESYRNFEERYGIDVGYRAIGYLLIVPFERWPAHQKTVELQLSLGASVEVFSPLDAQQWLPFEPSGIAACTVGRQDGVVDPYWVTQAFVTLAHRQGARFHFDSPVVRIDRDLETWRLATPDCRFEAPIVVNAAGAWAGAVAALDEVCG